MSFLRWAALVLIFEIILSSASLAQSNQTGLPSFSSESGGPWDLVNLANLNVHVALPVTARPGRGSNFRFGLSYDNTTYQNIGGFWLLNFNWVGIGGGTANAFAIQSAMAGFFLPGAIQQISCTGGGSGSQITYSNYFDPAQTLHPFTTNIVTNSCTGSGGTTTTSDGSGFTHRYQRRWPCDSYECRWDCACTSRSWFSHHQ